MTKRETLMQAVKLAAKLQRILIATVDMNGWPYLAVAGQLTLISDEQVKLVDWLDPITVVNLDQNSRLAILVWDEAAHAGYQLLGQAERIEEVGLLDGYIPDEEERPALPQVERMVLIRVDKISSFNRVLRPAGVGEAI